MSWLRSVEEAPLACRLDVLGEVIEVLPQDGGLLLDHLAVLSPVLIALLGEPELEDDGAGEEAPQVALVGPLAEGVLEQLAVGPVVAAGDQLDLLLALGVVQQQQQHVLLCNTRNEHHDERLTLLVLLGGDARVVLLVEAPGDHSD